jgi:hypothetical protein
VRRKVLLVVAGLVVIAGALSAWVALSAGRDLLAARRALGGSPGDLSGRRLAEARDHIRAALETLRSPPARLLGLVPIARQNVGAVRAVTEATLPVLTTGLELDRALDRVQRVGLMDRGRVTIERLTELRAPLAKEARALEDLAEELDSHRSGWLLPPLWTALDEQLGRTEALRDGAARAADALGLAPAMLGVDEPRRYLVLVLNNSELRGAGGILSGAGTITADDGRLQLSAFEYYRDLADEPPYRKVPAPKDYREHFRAYDAATTRWVATSSSPDVPDVARVAGRLYRVSRGVATDGALVIDARGIASLMPPAARVRVPGTDTVLTRRTFADYVLARVYRELDDQRARRLALIALGSAALDSVLEKGLGGRDSWIDVVRSAAAGHIRFVSFDAEENAVLEAAGVTGELGTPRADGSLVTVQNYGGTKLDYWARRRVRHACELDGDTPVCATEVRIENRTPPGLPPFVYQYRPYGLFKNYVEIYVPRSAELTAVEVDGRAAGFDRKAEDGYDAIGLYVEIPRGTETRVEVGYTLPRARDGFSVELRPQPQAHDAVVSVALTLPPGWERDGPGSIDDGVVRFSGDFDRTLQWTVAPSERTGVPALWADVTRFLREPLF